MILSTLGFTGYRAFDEPTVVEFRDLTVVLGKNNSGKTTLTRAPLFVESAVKQPHLFALSNGILRFGSSFDDIATRGQAHPALSYWVQLHSGARLGITLQSVLQELAETIHLAEITYGAFEVTTTLEFELELAGKRAPLPTEFDTSRTAISSALDGILHIPSARPAIVSIYETREPHAATAEEVPYWLATNPELLAEVDKWFTDHLDGQVVMAESIGFGFRLATSDRTESVNFASAGRGSQSLLPVVTLLKAAELGVIDPPIIVVEEPEAHLHPSAHGAIAELIARVSRTTQVIAETHSENFILRLRRLVATRFMQPDGLRLIYVDEDARATHIEVDELGGVSEWPSGVFEYDLEEARAIVEARLRTLGRD